jgi:TRAP-type C4-dicarboxylate transport system permease large subunit
MRQETVASSAARVLKDDNLLRLTASESSVSPACPPSLACIVFPSIARYRTSCSGKKRGNPLEFSALLND